MKRPLSDRDFGVDRLENRCERYHQTGIKPNFIVLLGERYGWRESRPAVCGVNSRGCLFDESTARLTSILFRAPSPARLRAAEPGL